MSWAVWYSILLLILVVEGCDRRTPERPGGDRIITDDLGRRIHLDGVPSRIVSLAPSLTETLYAIGADSLLVGVTSYCNYPAAAAEKHRVGDLLTPDIEGIVGLKPDLVLISVEGNSHATFRRLEQLGIRIFVSNPRNLDGVLKTIADIADITGRQSRGARYVEELRAVRDSIRVNGPKRPVRILMLLSIQPIIAAGAGTFINEIVVAAGGRNAIADVGGSYPVLGREEILVRDPEMLLFPDDLGAERGNLLQRFPEWRSLRAIRYHRVHALPADILMRPGPRVFDALREVHRLIMEAAVGSAE